MGRVLPAAVLVLLACTASSAAPQALRDSPCPALASSAWGGAAGAAVGGAAPAAAQAAPAAAQAAPAAAQAARTSARSSLWGCLADPEVAEAFAFLLRHLPARDRGVVPPEQLLQDAVLALQRRRAHSWASAVPWSLFLHAVLPHRSLDEPADELPWRPLFAEAFAPLVARASSLAEAIQLLNRGIWDMPGRWNISFIPNQTPAIMSPSQVIAAGHASCTGLSIFLVNACRSVGIPARVAGLPDYSPPPPGEPVPMGPHPLPKRPLNHDWVEAFDGEGWSFTGAAEFNPAGLNRTWFFPSPAKQATPGSFWHAVYASSYAPTGHAFPLAWAMHDRQVPGIDVSEHYIGASVLPGAPSALLDAGGGAQL